MNGWVKLHRQILNNVELMHDPTARFMFMHLLIKANPKGQVLISMEQLGSELGIEKTVAFRATQRLQKYGITQRSTQHRKSLITICNWHTYQGVTQRPTQNPRKTDATLTQRPPLSVRIENKNKESETANEMPLAPGKSFKAEYERLLKKQ